MSIKKFSPAFLKIVDDSARKCFGYLPVSDFRTGFKFLKRKPIGPLANNYYPENYLRTFKTTLDDFQTPEEDRRESALIRLKRRGKGPPKKGQGKRSGKKK